MQRRLEIVLGVAAIVLGLLFARYTLFTTFRPYDDEGYLLLSLLHYLHDGGLYTKTFTQYGPFYFYAQQAVHGLFHLPVTHDGARIVTLVYWYISSLLGGWFVYRISRNILLGSSAVLAIVILGRVLSNEPGHPQEIVLTLLMLASCLTLWTSMRPWPLLLLGGVGAALVFTKVNVGVFYVVALAHALLCLLPPGRFRGLSMTLTLVYALAFPPLLMHTHLTTWAWGYCLWAMLCGAAVFGFGWRTRSDSRVSIRHTLFACAGLLGVGAAIVMVTFIQGISLHTLVTGILIGPSGQPDAFSLPWHFAPWQLVIAALLLGLVSVLCTMTYASWIDAFRCLAGLAIVFTLIGLPRLGLILAVPLLPLLFLRPGERPFPLADLFPRLFVADLAVTQALQAYPVAGSQVAIAAAPALLCAFVCLSDGAEGLEQHLPLAFPRTAVAAAVILVLGIGVLASGFRFPSYRDPSLDLPGARLIHVAPKEAAQYRWLSDTLRSNCDVLFTMPGMGSLNLWSGVPTPNGFHLTHWMTVFGDARQQEILSILRAHPRACVVYNQGLLEAWVPDANRRLAYGPLASYILANMPVVAEEGGYQIRVSPLRASSFIGGVSGE